MLTAGPGPDGPVDHVLVARMDNLGDVLLSGPAVRAVAASAGRVTYLASPQGAAAASLLPGVNEVLVERAAWIDADPPRISRTAIDRLVDRLASISVDAALILTSFHQSPLPLALVLRMAGLGWIGAISPDYPGSLLDVRHVVDESLHEVERSLSLADAMGYRVPAGDDGALRIDPSRVPGMKRERLGPVVGPEGDYVVVHPGASVPARAWRSGGHRQVVERLAGAGWTVVVTGGSRERTLTARVAGSVGIDLGGRLDLVGLASVIGKANAIVVGNTGPAHLAAAMGTPVVSIYAPTVPASRWHPWMVPHMLLGEQDIACAGCRARTCPRSGHPCIDQIDTERVVQAVQLLTAPHRRAHLQTGLASDGVLR